MRVWLQIKSGEGIPLVSVCAQSWACNQSCRLDEVTKLGSFFDGKGRRQQQAAWFCSWLRRRRQMFRDRRRVRLCTPLLSETGVRAGSSRSPTTTPRCTYLGFITYSVPQRRHGPRRAPRETPPAHRPSPNRSTSRPTPQPPRARRNAQSHAGDGRASSEPEAACRLACLELQSAPRRSAGNAPTST